MVKILNKQRWTYCKRKLWNDTIQVFNKVLLML